MLKKGPIIIILVIIFSSCSTIYKSYDYIHGRKLEKISVVTFLKDEEKEFSPIKVIRLRDKRSDGVNKKHKLELLNNNIKLVKDGKEYIIPYSNLNNYEDIYIYKNGVNITDGDFTTYIGKVQLDTGEIIEIPPLHFKKYISIEKLNVILDALNQDAHRKSFFGTLEEYRKNGWKEE